MAFVIRRERRRRKLYCLPWGVDEGKEGNQLGRFALGPFVTEARRLLVFMLLKYLHIAAEGGSAFLSIK